MRRPLLLDLFCCEGGAATGYHAAGFDVIGVDRDPQPLYPFQFIQADALEVLAGMAELGLNGWSKLTYWVNFNPRSKTGPSGFPARYRFDAIHASPPCQSYSTMSNRFGSHELRLIDPVRELLQAIGQPYVIENVTGARSAMQSPVMIHGGQLGMTVYRPRLFESNVLLAPPPKAARPTNPIAVYGKATDGRLLRTRKDGTQLLRATLDQARVAMGMPWASWNGCREAIPPAYTEFIGRQLIEQLDRKVVAA